MAASAPHSVSNWKNETLQYPSLDDSRGVEVGMAGLNFTSSIPSSTSRPPALSGSSVSSGADDPHPHQNNHHYRHHSFSSFSFPNSDSQQFQSNSNSLPPSPSSQAAIGTLSHKMLSKPPGLFEPSTLASLTHRPFDQNWTTDAKTDADSFDRSEDADDGLLGLGAMRERAHSSPGPIFPVSSSPPVRIDVNPFQAGDLSPLYTDGERGRGLPPDPRRTRPQVSKSAGSGSARPPLSGHATLQQNALDNSFGSASNYGGRGSPAASEFSYDFSHVPSGRSDLAERLQGRARSLTAGSDPTLHDGSRSLRGEHFRPHNIDHSHKFGTLTPLSNISIQQRLPQQHHPQVLPPNRHIRSYSHSGTLRDINDIESHDGHGFADSTIRTHHQRLHSDGADPFPGDFYTYGLQETSNIPRSASYNDRLARSAPPGLIQRSVSVTQAMQHQNFDAGLLHRRNSDFLGDPQYTVPSSRYPSFPNLRSRDEILVASDGNGLVRSVHEDTRSFGSKPYDDGGRNHPVMYNVAAHRQTEYAYLSTDHLSGGDSRNDARFVCENQHYSGLDDDLTHPLAGEDIDDPGDDLGVGNHNAMIPSGHQFSQMVYPRNDLMSSSNRSPSGMLSLHPPSMESILRHASGSIPSSFPRHVYTIKFKRTQRNFVPGPRIFGDLKIGCYVKVEADRGEDLGIVVNKLPSEKFNTSGRTGSRGSVSPGGVNDMGVLLAPSMTNLADLKRVVRLATHDEVSLLVAKREEEEELLKICREKVQQRSLPMHVVDAEYQFDRHKLTFFFEAECRIDFRELVRDLFSMYKTRIWMQQLDKNTAGVGSPNVPSPPVSFGSMNQIPIMADSIDDPYGIPQQTNVGSGGGGATH